MFNKKSQAAMEFLMTYGWAIMIVLIGIGALFFLGVFNPSTPSSCNIASPFVCQDVTLKNDQSYTAGLTVTQDLFIMKIASTGIDSATLKSITINEMVCDTSAPLPQSTPTDLLSSKERPISIFCLTGGTASFSEGQKYSGTFEIAWNKAFGLPHTVKGTFSGTVEKNTGTTLDLSTI